MNFFPEKKKHISPSAFASWFESRSAYIRSYFLGEKSPETGAMKAGKQIHQLIEGNFLKAKHKYEHPETILCFAIFEGSDGLKTEQVEVRADGTYDLPEGAIGAVYGVPDSFEVRAMTGEYPYVASFVDYKSGKENTWDDVKLAGDLKMKLTAFLVWLATNKPDRVIGYIEYVPTVYNPLTKETEPTEGETTVAGKCEYSYAEMSGMLKTVVATMREINKAFLEWEESTDEFINQDDVTTYAELEARRSVIEARQKVLKERIGEQMTMGKKETYSTPFGTFFFSTKRKFAYPKDLQFNAGSTNFTLESADEISTAAEAAKKKFETENEPESVTKAISFRPKK